MVDEGILDVECTGLGLMSGTSCDGLDMALVRFSHKGYTLLEYHTAAYEQHWQERLQHAHTLGGEALMELEVDYTAMCAGHVLSFMHTCAEQPEYIAAHGHTIYHRPEAGLSWQMINGGQLAVACGVQTVCDFRRADVALGGQGAPLVPMGDRLLFDAYDACLNLGGIANVSFERAGQRLAYDICPANMPLNMLARQRGSAYDAGGAMALRGRVQPALLQALQHLAYYAAPAPKSLGREWVEQHFNPLLQGWEVEDMMATVCEHIALQVAEALASVADQGRVLVTGGGVHHVHLMGRIAQHSHWQVAAADPVLVDAKEALVFALLGYLRLRGFNTTLASVTGAARGHCGGAVYLP